VLPDGLSMLWESAEPGSALEQRFGFADLGSVSRWVGRALGDTWGIAVEECTRIVISGQNAVAWVRSDRGDLVVKWSRATSLFAGLEASTRLLGALAERDVPVAAPHATADGRVRVVIDGPAGPLSVAVLPQLAGSWLDTGDLAAVEAAGACLAEVHRAMATIDPEPPVPVLPGRPAERVALWLAAGDHGVVPAASQRLAALVAAAPELDDRPQLVHNDFRAANVLTQGTTITGVLDLDDVVVDHPVGDLAKASTYLGTLFRNWRPTPAAARRALRTGYETVRPLDPAEAGWLEILQLWHGLLAVPGAHDPAGWAAAVET
jgi:homoserine kinase type II